MEEVLEDSVGDGVEGVCAGDVAVAGASVVAD